MGKSYRPYLPDQEFLLPPNLRDLLPEDHLVYFVSDVIDNLNLSAMDAVYGEEQRGQPPYDPRMMTKLQNPSADAGKPVRTGTEDRAGSGCD